MIDLNRMPIWYAAKLPRNTVSGFRLRCSGLSLGEALDTVALRLDPVNSDRSIAPASHFEAEISHPD